MLRLIDHDGVRELEMSSWASRRSGYKVSAFLHRGILIDTGFPRVRRELAMWLDRQPINGAIVTHWHEDHAGNLPLLVERDIPVSMPAATLARVRVPAPIPLYRWLVWGSPTALEKPPADVAHPFELIPTPGHTDDHVAVWDPDERIAFVGDLFLGVRAAVVHPNEDPIALTESLRRIIALAPRTVFDAHRGLIRKPVESLTAKVAWLEETIAAIRALQSAGIGEAETTRRVLGKEGPVRFMSRGEMSKLNFVRAVGARSECRKGGRSETGV